MTRKGVPYSWEISQPDGNEGTDISRYCSLGAPERYGCFQCVLSFAWSLGSPAQPPSLLAMQGRRWPAAVSKPSRVGGRGKWPYLRL